MKHRKEEDDLYRKFAHHREEEDRRIREEFRVRINSNRNSSFDYLRESWIELIKLYSFLILEKRTNGKRNWSNYQKDGNEREDWNEVTNSSRRKKTLRKIWPFAEIERRKVWLGKCSSTKGKNLNKGLDVFQFNSFINFNLINYKT